MSPNNTTATESTSSTTLSTLAPAVANYHLFTPLRLGDDLVLRNRVVLSPMTRARADKTTHVPTEMMAEYYAMRAGAGLLITDAAAISPQGFGWYGAPAIYNDEQMRGWKAIVERVHARGGTIFIQLWHMGRMAHSSYHPDGATPVSASSVANRVGYTRNAAGDRVPFETPRPVTIEEIPSILDQYRRAAELAREAGFDGIELHSGNGSLPDQFLQSCTNHRQDAYGGSISNRTRFVLEVLDALLQVWPAHRIGIRLAPNNIFDDMGSPDNYEQFVYAMGRLRAYGLGYLAILDGVGFGHHGKSRTVTVTDAKAAFQGPVIATNSYTRDTAEGVLRSGAADAVGFGRPFISNPDLAERFANDWPLAPAAPLAHYWDADVPGDEGYLTYQTYKQLA